MTTMITFSILKIAKLLRAWKRYFMEISLFVIKVHCASKIGNSEESLNTERFFCARHKQFYRDRRIRIFEKVVRSILRSFSRVSQAQTC